MKRTSIIVGVAAALLLLALLMPGGAAEGFACSPGFRMKDGECV